MSTILKALRRLENEKQEQQAAERLHGEVVAPAPPTRGASWQRALLLLGAGFVAAGLGAAVYVFVLGDSSPEEIEVASNVASMESANEVVVPTAQNPPPVSPPRPQAAQPKAPAVNEVALQRAEKRKQRLAARAAKPQSTATARTSAAATPQVASAKEPDPWTEAPAVERETALDETPVEDLPLEVPPVRRAPEPSFTSAGTKPPTRSTPKPSATTASAPKPATRSVDSSTAPPSSETSTTTPPKTPSTTAAVAPSSAPREPATKSAASEPSVVASSAPGSALAFEIARTVWHPQPDRRVAYLQNAEGERVEVREGDLYAGWRIDGISPSSVRFARADETTNRRVGQSIEPVGSID